MLTPEWKKKTTRYINQYRMAAGLEEKREPKVRSGSRASKETKKKEQESGVKYLYMAVEKDKYELPIYVADSVEELAEKMQVGKDVIFRAIKRGRKSKYIRVVDTESELDKWKTHLPYKAPAKGRT